MPSDWKLTGTESAHLQRGFNNNARAKVSGQDDEGVGVLEIQRNLSLMTE